jgi:hypothetical protein
MKPVPSNPAQAQAGRADESPSQAPMRCLALEGAA